jgi:hypothetical protein
MIARIPLEVLPDAANRDGEFRIAARFWDCTLRIDEGGRGNTIQIENGRITAVEPAGAGTSWDLRIAAPAEEWEKLLARVPRPFYQDLYGAVMHHGFGLEGGLSNRKTTFREVGFESWVRLLAAARELAGVDHA